MKGLPPRRGSCTSVPGVRSSTWLWESAISIACANEALSLWSNSFSVNVLPIDKWKRCCIFSHFISQQQTAQGIFLSWSTVGWDEAERIPAYFPFNISSLSRQKRTLPRLQLHDCIVPPVLIVGLGIVERVVQTTALMPQAGATENQLSHGGQVA